MIVACVVEVKGSAVMVVYRVERCDPGNTTEIAESNFDDGNYSVSGRVLLTKHKPDGYTWRSGAYSQSRLTNISVKHIIAIKPSATTTTFNDSGDLTGVKYTFGGASLMKHLVLLILEVGRRVRWLRYKQPGTFRTKTRMVPIHSCTSLLTNPRANGNGNAR
jgi:hypothetical protein